MRRIRYIDLAKGFAMLLVIIGHCAYTPDVIVGWLYSFHMPLFFILSGYTFYPERYPTFCNFADRKVKKLIVPYVWLSVCLFVLRLAFRDRFAFSSVHLKAFVGIFIGWRTTDWYCAMWYIPALFLSECTVYLVLHGRKNPEKTTLFGLMPAFALGMLFYRYAGALPWSVDQVPYGVFFMLSGMQLRRYMDSPKHPVIVMMFAWTLNITCAILNFRANGRVDMYSCGVGNPLLFALAAIGGATGTIIFARFARGCRPLEYIGRNSIVFYAFQNAFVIPALDAVLIAVFHRLGMLPHPTAAFVLIVIGTCLVLMAMNEAISRFCPFMLGRRHNRSR